MTRYSIESRTRKYVKKYGYFSFTIDLSSKYWEQLLDAAYYLPKDIIKCYNIVSRYSFSTNSLVLI